MSRRIPRPALTALGSLALLAATAGPALAGPPWISVELPANPLDPTTRDAFLVVHTYHHAQVMLAPVTGRAIGVVDGQRRTIELTFTRTSTWTITRGQTAPGVTQIGLPLAAIVVWPGCRAS